MGLEEGDEDHEGAPDEPDTLQSRPPQVRRRTIAGILGGVALLALVPTLLSRLSPSPPAPPAPTPVITEAIAPTPGITDVIATSPPYPEPAIVGMIPPGMSAEGMRMVMLSVAAQEGDPSPTWIEAVSTTLPRAVSASRPAWTVTSNGEPVYLAVMKGDFTTTSIPPPGAPEASGHYSTVIFAEYTLQTLGTSIIATTPNLARLGPVVNLLKLPPVPESQL
ncbi:MAG TPA: hypothetical protein VGG54_18115, partial [Trebonia sp.]